MYIRVGRISSRFRFYSAFNCSASRYKLRTIRCLPFMTDSMENSTTTTNSKREHEDGSKTSDDQPATKSIKIDTEICLSKFGSLKHGKGRPVSKHILNQLTADDVQLLETVTTTCIDLDKIKKAVQLRKKHKLSIKLPEDDNDSSYYVEKGLRKVYPYQFLYQSYAKQRWIGRKLKDVLQQEFRDITDEQLKRRFEMARSLVNGEPVDIDYVLKGNDFIINRNHRHELPVLAVPIKIIYEDKDTIVVDKPPSVPIHPCGRFRHNSVTHILSKENNFKEIRVVHRLDRLVSGVLLIAKNSARAHVLEKSIRSRNVHKEYVCRVVGEFPSGNTEDDGEITVDQPLEIIQGKIGITVVLPEGKPSVTKFKCLNYNGKTSAVLCKPQTGRMHQIRVHLQFLGHPIVNDSLYNCSSFGPERGKQGRYGKSLKQLSADVISMHRASTWQMSNDDDLIDSPEPPQTNSKSEPDTDDKSLQFLSDEERAETRAALAHFHNDDSSRNLEQKYKFDPSKYIVDPTCRDCVQNFYDPPLRNLFLYLHALRYTGPGWSYESELPVWALESWRY